MIDINLLLEDFEETARGLMLKGVELETITKARDLLVERRALQKDLDEKRAVVNKSSKLIGKLLSQGETESSEQKKQEVTRLKQEISKLEEQLNDVGERFDYIVLRLPNSPAKGCPEGTSEVDNVILRHEQYDEKDYQGKKFLPHWEIGTNLRIYDAERASKISGSMFGLLRGEGARLLWALVNFGIDLHRGKYEPVAPPHFVRSKTFTGTGHLPKFEFDAYKLRDDDLWAIPTGEVPLMGLHFEEILDEADLPKRYLAYTICFRREAGSAGKDTRGLQRLHEFQKVELLILCTPERVQAEFEGMLADAEKTLQVLGLPYRVVDLCTADLTFSSARIYDLEVYAPGVDRWLEVSSVGIFTDFQARRGGIRYRPAKGRPRYVHALNGSGIATPRIWAAILEHGQQPDGSVKLPEALVPYMGTDVIRRA